MNAINKDKFKLYVNYPIIPLQKNYEFGISGM